MLASGVSPAGKLFRVRSVAVVLVLPPREPLAERVVVAIWRSEVGRSRSYLPFDFAVLQPAPRKIISAHRNVGASTNKKRGFGFIPGRYFKFRPAKLLHLKTVTVFAFTKVTVNTLRLEFHRGIPKIHVRRQLES